MKLSRTLMIHVLKAVPTGGIRVVGFSFLPINEQGKGLLVLVLL